MEPRDTTAKEVCDSHLLPPLVQTETLRKLIYATSSQPKKMRNNMFTTFLRQILNNRLLLIIIIGLKK